MRSSRVFAILFLLTLQGLLAAAFLYTIDSPVADTPQSALGPDAARQALNTAIQQWRQQSAGAVGPGWSGSGSSAASPALLSPALAGSGAPPRPWMSPSLTNLHARAQMQRVLTDVGPHWRTYAVAPTNAPVTARGRKVMEIGTGMNYWDGSQWARSDPTFVATGDGFSASRVVHNTHLNANLNSDRAVTVTMPTTNGPMILSSTPVAIALYDAASGNSAVIAGITDCQGLLIQSNKVLYQNCFAPVQGSPAGLSADVVYTIERGALHQDVVLTRRLNPADWGFPPKTTCIQVVTELFDAPDPERMTRPLRVEKSAAVRARMVTPDLMDEVLAFGDAVFGAGRAYTGMTGYSLTNRACAVVAKQMVATQDGRRFIVEGVEYPSVKTFLAMLPAASAPGQASVFRNAQKPQTLYAKLRRIGSGDLAAKRPQPQELASVNASARSGFVIDYWMNIGGTFNADYTFQKNVTYYVKDNFYCNGNATFESAVFKFPGDRSTSIVLETGANCKTTACDPAFFTGGQDDSIGDEVNYDLGDYFNAAAPALYCYGSGSWSLHDMRFLGAQEAIHFDAQGDTSALVANSQFVACCQVVGLTAASGGGGSGDDGGSGWTPSVYITLNNCLMSAPCYTAVAGGSGTWTFNNCTIDACAYQVVWGNYQGNYNFVNSIVSRAASFSDGTPIGGQNNGFYGCSDGSFGFSPVVPADSNLPFQPSWYGGYYLSDGSGFRGQGVNLYPDLVGGLAGKTTTPPLLLWGYGWSMHVTGEMMLSPQIPRYATGPPDLGYYYDAMDYVVSDFGADGARITVLPGTSIGVLNYAAGFLVGGGASFVSEGSPVKPITYTSIKYVQEPTITHAAEPLPNPVYDGDWAPCGIATFAAGSGPGGNPPSLSFRFCNFYLPPEDSHFRSGWDPWVPNFFLTTDSVAYWNLRDCLVSGGAVFVGLPSDQTVTWWATGAYNWFNNVFDRADVNLDPFGEEIQWPHTLDLSFQAYNNTFRTAAVRVESAANSDGSAWIFKDNLFDQIAFEQDTKEEDTTLPLTHDYNAYLELSSSDLGNYTTPYQTLASQFARLKIVDSSVDGPDDQIIPGGPIPYASGPLGDLYLPYVLYPTYGHGSRTASAAGLYHYTTRPDQLKEGEETTPGHMVNIGAHYVATASEGSSQLRDTDGDGIPDFVENALGDGSHNNLGETDWSYNDPQNPDSLSPVYDDQDLSGDGIVGRMKRALGMQPFDSGNPLVLTPVDSGKGPDVAAYILDMDYNSLTNIGVSVEFDVDGQPPDEYGIFRSADTTNLGKCKVRWNTTFSDGGTHFYGVKLWTRGGTPQDALRPAVLSATGPLTAMVAPNLLRFDPRYTDFYNSGDLYAKLQVSSATYIISLYNPSAAPGTQAFLTIPGSTSDGIIHETWDATSYQGTSAKAVFNVTYAPGATETHAEPLEKRPSLPVVPEGRFTIAFTVDFEDYRNGIEPMMQLHVVDNLLNPYANANGALQGPEYPSAFNRPSYGGLGGDPGYIPDNDWIDVLMNDLKWTSPSGGDTRNLFFTGHGTPQWMGNIWGTVGMCADDVGAVLGNYYDEDDTLHRQHPFRFVFLWGCNTASVDWARAFGVIDGSPTDLLDDIRRDPSYAQALIGYKGFGGGAESSLEWMQWSYALEYLSANWMNQVAIYRIMVEIQKPRTSDGTQLPVHFGPSSLDRNARLDIRGFGGLKRTGYTEQFP